jgi:hypothetical protein
VDVDRKAGGKPFHSTQLENWGPCQDLPGLLLEGCVVVCP